MLCSSPPTGSSRPPAPAPNSSQTRRHQAQFRYSLGGVCSRFALGALAAGADFLVHRQGLDQVRHALLALRERVALPALVLAPEPVDIRLCGLAFADLDDA